MTIHDVINDPLRPPSQDVGTRRPRLIPRTWPELKDHPLAYLALAYAAGFGTVKVIHEASGMFTLPKAEWQALLAQNSDLTKQMELTRQEAVGIKKQNEVLMRDLNSCRQKLDALPTSKECNSKAVSRPPEGKKPVASAPAPASSSGNRPDKTGEANGNLAGAEVEIFYQDERAKDAESLKRKLMVAGATIACFRRDDPPIRTYLRYDDSIKTPPFQAVTDYFRQFNFKGLPEGSRAGRCGGNITISLSQQ